MPTKIVNCWVPKSAICELVLTVNDAGVGDVQIVGATPLLQLASISAKNGLSGGAGCGGRNQIAPRARIELQQHLALMAVACRGR